MIKGIPITKFFIFIGLMISSVSLRAHGGHIAVYKYQIEPRAIILEVQVENSVLEHINLEKECPTYKTTTAFCLAQYINASNTFHIDDVNIQFELQGSKKDEIFFTLKMKAIGDFSECENIRLKNDCFFEFDRKFENRIIIEKQGSVKSYLLNRKNKNLSINCGE